MKIQSLPVLVRFITCLSLIVILFISNVGGLMFAFAQEESDIAPMLGFCTDITQISTVTDGNEVFIYPELRAEVSVGPDEYFTVGDTVSFSVSISNSYPYAVANANVLLAIVNNQTGSVLDYVTYSDSISLPANGSVDILLPLGVSDMVHSGEYRAVVYVGQTSHDVLLSNALGKASGAGEATFSLMGNEDGAPTLRFALGAVQIGSAQGPLGMVYTIPGDNEQTNVTLRVQNAHSESKLASITWNLYAGLSAHPMMLVDTQTDSLTFDPTSQVEVSYDIATEAGQYTVVAELTDALGSRQLAMVSIQKSGKDLVVSERIPPVLQLTHLGLNEAGQIVGCIGAQNETRVYEDTEITHLPIPFVVELALYTSEQSLINGEEPAKLLRVAESISDVFRGGMGFVFPVGHEHSGYIARATVSQFDRVVSEHSIPLECVGGNCSAETYFDYKKSTSGSMFSNIQYGIVITAMILFFIIIYTFYGHRKPEDQE